MRLDERRLCWRIAHPAERELARTADIVESRRPAADPGAGDTSVADLQPVDSVGDGRAARGASRSTCTTPDAADLIGRPAAVADIMVTNVRPATLRRFRIDFDDLRAYRSDLVMVHARSAAPTPYTDRPCSPASRRPSRGLTYRRGDPDQPSAFAGYPVADGSPASTPRSRHC